MGGWGGGWEGGNAGAAANKRVGGGGGGWRGHPVAGVRRRGGRAYRLGGKRGWGMTWRQRPPRRDATATAGDLAQPFWLASRHLGVLLVHGHAEALRLDRSPSLETSQKQNRAKLSRPPPPAPLCGRVGAFHLEIRRSPYFKYTHTRTINAPIIGGTDWDRHQHAGASQKRILEDLNTLCIVAAFFDR